MEARQQAMMWWIMQVKLTFEEGVSYFGFPNSWSAEITIPGTALTCQVCGKQLNAGMGCRFLSWANKIICIQCDNEGKAEKFPTHNKEVINYLIRIKSITYGDKVNDNRKREIE